MDGAKTGKGANAGARRRRTPRKVTPDRLHRIALHYLERYASSTENLWESPVWQLGE